MPGPVLGRALGRHLLLAALVAALVSGLTVAGVRLFAEADALRTAERTARQIASAVVEPMSRRDLGRPGGVDRQALLSDLSPYLGSGMIDRVKVFTVQAKTTRVVFSDERRIEGFVAAVRPELSARLDRGEVVVQPVPDGPEHAYEHDLPGDRLEAYIPFRDASGAAGQLEVYVPVSAGETTRYAAAVVVPFVLAGLLLLALATIPLSVTRARRQEQDRAEQRAVRRYGLAAAELTRRDLAQRLHDGVIPDLSSASLLLEAVHAHGLRPGSYALELVGRAQELVADDVQRLRGLLDELVPSPSVAAQPEVALQELVDRLRRMTGDDGPAVEIVVTEGETLPEDVAVLAHRVAGELLRNAFRHARAGTVRVVLERPTDGAVRLTVADDGVGFERSASRRPGHIGLQLVEEVVRDSGGRMVISSGPAAGTTVLVDIPRQWPSGRGFPSPRSGPR